MHKVAEKRFQSLREVLEVRALEGTVVHLLQPVVRNDLNALLRAVSAAYDYLSGALCSRERAGIYPRETDAKRLQSVPGSPGLFLPRLIQREISLSLDPPGQILVCLSVPDKIYHNSSPVSAKISPAFFAKRRPKIVK